MAPRKRKADAVDDSATPHAQKTTRTIQTVEKTASSSRPKRTSLIAANAPKSTWSSTSGTGSGTPAKTTKKMTTTSVKARTQTTPKAKFTQGQKRARKASSTSVASTQANSEQQATFSIDVPIKTVNGNIEDHEDERTDGPSYWLMKAEPDSRIEKGKDVKFSIDDLKTATAPEPWDGTYELWTVFIWAASLIFPTCRRSQCCR